MGQPLKAASAIDRKAALDPSAHTVPSSEEELLCAFNQRCQVAIGLLHVGGREELLEALRLLGGQVPQVASFRAQVVLAGLLAMMVERSRCVVAAVHGPDEYLTMSLERLLQAGLKRLGAYSGSSSNVPSREQR